MDFKTEYAQRKEIERIENERRRARERSEFAVITAAMDRVLAEPAHPAQTLDRQAVLLDSLLTAVMRRNLDADRKNGAFDNGGIDLALRIQKQCVATIKTTSAINYMQSIVSQSVGVWPPLPLPRIESHPLPTPAKTVERTIKET